MTYSEIKTAILELDEHSLSLENLRSLKQYIPTDEEAELLKSYSGEGSLGNAEKYFLEILSIPRLSERFTSMIYKRRFEADLEEIKPELAILQLSSQELRNSQRFAAILKMVLAIGNFMNGASFRGCAQGFRLEALLMMKDIKTLNDKNDLGIPSLLHYLVVQLERKNPEALSFMEEMPHVEAAGRVSFSVLLTSANALIQGLQQVKSEIRAVSRLPILDPNDKFLYQMSEFVKKTEPSVNELKVLCDKLDEDLKQLLVFYGEEPSDNPEDFFSIISSFASAITKARKDLDLAKKKAMSSKRNDRRGGGGGKDLGLGFSPVVTTGIAMEQGDLDEAIRELRNGVRRKRTGRIPSSAVKRIIAA